MSALVERAGRRFLLALDPELAHTLSIKALAHGLGGLANDGGSVADPRLVCRIAGLDWPNPIGMAAGYDKNAEVPEALLGLGFGFVEIGTVTPRPQSGNRRPRIFRLAGDRAVINRLGFNNAGHRAVLQNLEKRAGQGIVGVNVGANKDSDDRIADYVSGIETFFGVASYFTVNVSSPNTPGLRDLQAGEALRRLLGEVLAARQRLAASLPNRSTPPVFLKIAPDLADADLDAIAETAAAAAVDGLIIANTTLSRTGLSGRGPCAEAGGLSGQPLFERSTIVLAKMRQRLGPATPLIGVGGVASAEQAAEKMCAGADLVQLYTGLIYRGPGLPKAILRGLCALCDRQGLPHIDALRDRHTERWAARVLTD